MMRQLLFIAVMSLILLPLCALHEGWTTLDEVAEVVGGETVRYYRQAENWLWDE
jgi:hypothetical protein